ncbi:MAG: hypothetical protein JSV43_05205 [Methanobacteriota archaeon]|nr:MAG: hypothetical protein JSV43_05205 [Euryarchaeota archaeon]
MDAAVLLIILGIVLSLLGLVLGFWGWKIWPSMMALLGALIGGALGYIIGYNFFNEWYIVMILAIIFSVIVSMIFGYLVEIGLAFILGLMAFVPLYLMIGGTTGIVVGAIALAIIFAIAYYYIEEVISIATALIGGVMIAGGLWLLGASPGIYIGVGVLVFVLGAIFQLLTLRKHRMPTQRMPAY